MWSTSILNLCLSGAQAAPLSVAALFGMGVLGSFTHCSVMCSPFIAMQLSAAPQGVAAPSKGALLLPYHMGRITTYTMLGIVAALMVAATGAIDEGLRRAVSALVLTLAAFLFLGTAWPRLGKYLPKIKAPRLPSRLFGYLLDSPTFSGRFGLGLLLGFLPCGLVWAAVLAASSAGRADVAALGMLAFGAGTVPALMGVGYGVRLAARRWPNAMRTVSTTLLLINGFGLLGLAGSLIF